MKRILPRLHAFTGLILGHVYLIGDDDGLTIVDAGLGSATPKIVSQLRAAGYRPGDVKRILVTHAHIDHVGGLPELSAATGAQVVCSTIEKPFTEGKQPLVRKGGKAGTTMKGTPVDRMVDDGEVLTEVLGGLHVVATPGHSPGQIAFWQPQLGVLICGDTMMNLFGLRLPFDAFTADMAEARRSVAKVARLEPRVVCFGHGSVLMDDAAQKVSEFARRVS
jgi:glyoxylase-like metal-dependent hydrolase (beta-lactamase superfamily II)